MNTDLGTSIEHSVQRVMEYVFDYCLFHCFIRAHPCNPRFQLHGWLGIDPSTFVVFARFACRAIALATAGGHSFCPTWVKPYSTP